MNKYKVWILLILCNLFWAGNYVFGKYVVGEMSPLWITFTRWLLASLILLGIAYYFEKPDLKIVIKSWPSLLAMAILGIVGYNMILYAALDYTSSINASLVNSLNPGVIVIFSAVLLKEKISKLQGLGILVSLMGVLVILTSGKLGQLFNMEYNTGDLLMLAAIVMWTLYSIVSRRLKAIPPITATAVSGIIASVIMAPFAIAQGIDFKNISTLAITGIVYITLFPSVGSFVFWNMSVREIGASRAGIFLNLIPVFTAAISWILGQRITVIQIVGGILVFLGVYLTTGMLEAKLKKASLQK